MSTCASSIMSAVPTAAKSNQSPEPDFVVRAQQGDEEAFAVLFEQYKRRVYSICLLMTGDAAEAEDLTQDAFVRVFGRLNTFRGDAAFSTWLYRVVVNTVLMKLRKRKPQQVSYDNPLSVGESMLERDFGRSDTQLEGVLDRITLARAIKELPEGYRTVFILHDVLGYHHHEIAPLLCCSLGTSKSQLHKARLKIRELLTEGSKAAADHGARSNRSARSKTHRLPSPAGVPVRAEGEQDEEALPLELVGAGKETAAEGDKATCLPARL